MPRATNTSTTIRPRRAFLGQTAYLTVAAIGAAGVLYSKADSALAQEPDRPARLPVFTDSADADLMAWCAEFCDLEQQIEAIFDAHPAPTVAIEKVACPVRDALAEPLGRQQRRLIDRICAVPATTVEGYIALVEVLASIDPPPKADDPSRGSGARIQDHLLRSLAGRARA